MMKKTPSHSLKRYFLTGLLALLPLIITAVAIGFLWHLLQTLIDPVVRALLAMVLPPALLEALSAWQAPTALGLVVLAVVVLAVGFLAQQIIGRTLVSMLDLVFSHIPIVSGIYEGVRQVTSAFDPGGKALFQEVVLVPAQPGGPLGLGFITNRLPADARFPEGLALVYIPTNNLYIGTTIAAEPKTIIPLPLTVEQGMRLVVSAGLALPQEERGPEGKA
jgi:uncharacterized membrane protein